MGLEKITLNFWKGLREGTELDKAIFGLLKESCLKLKELQVTYMKDLPVLVRKEMIDFCVQTIQASQASLESIDVTAITGVSAEA